MKYYTYNTWVGKPEMIAQKVEENYFVTIKKDFFTSDGIKYEEEVLYASSDVKLELDQLRKKLKKIGLELNFYETSYEEAKSFVPDSNDIADKIKKEMGL